MHVTLFAASTPTPAEYEPALAALGRQLQVETKPAALAGLTADARVLVEAEALPAFADFGPALFARRAQVLLARLAAHDSTLGTTERGLRAGVEARLLPLCARVIVPNPASGEEVAKAGLAAGARLAVLACGSDPQPRSDGSGTAEQLLVAFGSAQAQKTVLRVLARLRDLRWRLVLASAEAQAAAALVTELGLGERVYVTPTLAEALWRQADVLVQGEDWDSFGAAVAQALRRGVAVASAAGGAPQTLLAPTGIACPPGDFVTLGKVLRRLLADEALRAEVKESAWQAGQALPDWPTQTAVLTRLLGG